MAKPRKGKPVDYRALKKALNPYFNFTFEMPKKGRDFTPQQKSSLTRKYKKLSEYLDRDGQLKTDEISFIKYPKGSNLPGIDGVKLGKGIIYKFPGAKVIREKTKRGKKTNRFTVSVHWGDRRERFFPFPKSVIGNLEKIKEFVAALVKKHRPYVVRWSTHGRRAGQRYAPELFDRYFQTYVDDSDINEDEINDNIAALEKLIKSKKFEQMYYHEKREIYRRKAMLEKYIKDRGYYNGVFLIFHDREY